MPENVPEPRALISDPSPLTTQALLREIQHATELSEAQLANLDTRISGIEKAATLFESNLTRVPTEVEKTVGHLKEFTLSKLDLISEQFKSVETQFTERDTRAEKLDLLNQKAVDAAFAAQKESVNKQQEFSSEVSAKMEASFTKQSDAQAALIATAVNSIRELLAGIDKRVTVIEGRDMGSKTTKDDGRAGNHLAVAVGAVVISFIAVVAAIAIAMFAHVPVR